MPKKQPIAQPREITAADSFADVEPEKATKPKHKKRVTITVSEELHRKIKLSCVGRGINMADALREAVERAAWPMAAEAA
jgi:predicted DNA binding CopG/RHH family protein